MTENTIAEAINNIEDIKKGYITGFFDAEGNIDIKDDYVLSVLINQAHKQVLESINKVFPMPSGIQIHSKEGYDSRGVHRKGAWRWRLHSDDAIPFLKYIQTYSIEKRPQVELAIKYQEETTRHHSRSGGMFKLSQTEIEQREWFKKEINDLKYVESNTQQLKNYDNEIKKQRISKDIRDGKQKTIFSLQELYKFNEIEVTEEPKEQIKSLNMPNYIETGYLSGFFDGEGYIGIDKSKKGSYTLRVAITNTNFNMLKQYASKFGGKIRNSQKSEEYHKDKYQWGIDHNYALTFLKYIQNWTLVKRKQVDVAIEFQEWHNSIKIIKTEEQKKKAENYYIVLKELKKETGEPNEITENQEPENITITKVISFDTSNT